MRWRLAKLVVVAALAVTGCSAGGDGATSPTTQRPGRQLECSDATVDDLVAAVAAAPNGLAADTARGLLNPTCVGDLALAWVCLLCADGEGATFQVLLQRDPRGEWRLVEIGDEQAITSAGSRAGISVAKLSVLRGAARG